MKKIVIINGPNLNLLGTRETGVYGNQNWDTYYKELQETLKSEVELNYFQSNSEGELINAIQKFGKECDGIVLNPGGYTHTSIAIADAVKAIKIDVVCVHISLVHKREEERKTDLIAAYASGYLSGLGLEGYKLAVECFI
jgi:3-dehydroquinate dehydratase-2